VSWFELCRLRVGDYGIWGVIEGFGVVFLRGSERRNEDFILDVYSLLLTSESL